MQLELENKQVSVAFILSLVSGFLIVLQGALRVIRTQWGLELGLGELRRHVVGGLDYKVLGVISIVLGVMVIVGCLLLRIPSRRREGGITVIAFSALSISAGGGYYAAVVLGVLGGALAISEYKQEQASLSRHLTGSETKTEI